MQVMHNFWQLLVNTLLYVVGCSLASTFVPCITAYAVAKFPEKKMSSILYGTVLVTMMIPIVGSYMVVQGQVSSADSLGTAIARAAATIIIIIPVVLLSAFCQKFLVKSISRSGMAN